MRTPQLYHCRVTCTVAGFRVEETLAFQPETMRDAFRLEAGRRGWLVVSNWKESLHDVDSAVAKMLQAIRAV